MTNQAWALQKYFHYKSHQWTYNRTTNFMKICQPKVYLMVNLVDANKLLGKNAWKLRRTIAGSIMICPGYDSQYKTLKHKEPNLMWAYLWSIKILIALLIKTIYFIFLGFFMILVFLLSNCYLKNGKKLLENSQSSKF